MGQTVNMDTMPLRWGHFRVLIAASLGQLLGAALATLVGIIIPLIRIRTDPGLSAMEQGVIGCIELIGIMIGSLVIGRLSDRYGYLLFFRLCPILVFVCSIWAYAADGIVTLFIALFLMGCGIGGEYSLDPDYISEIMPKRWKLTMVGIAKACCSIGNFVTAGLCFLLLDHWNNPDYWNRLLLTISGFAAVMILTRIWFAESPGWLIAHGKPQKALEAVRYFLGKDVSLGNIVQKPLSSDKKKVSWSLLLRKGNRKKVILGGIPWACEGVGVYGVGVFTPVLILSLGLGGSDENAFMQVLESVKLTSFVNTFILIGFIIGLLLLNKIYHIRIQTAGFLLSALGVALMLVNTLIHGNPVFTLCGFLWFELFLNAGPHLMTFILPTQIYPVEERGSGVGLSAAIGKLGAVLGVLLIPLLLKWGGSTLVLAVVIGVSLLGAGITALIGRQVCPDPYAEAWKF